MNLVRLGMIVGLCSIALYAVSVYAAIPPGEITEAPRKIEKTVEVICPVVTTAASGAGAIWVALFAITGAITVSAVDLSRRVY